MDSIFATIILLVGVISIIENAQLTYRHYAAQQTNYKLKVTTVALALFIGFGTGSVFYRAVDYFLPEGQVVSMLAAIVVGVLFTCRVLLDKDTNSKKVIKTALKLKAQV